MSEGLFVPHVEYESGWFSSMFVNNRTGVVVNGSLCKHLHKHEHTARRCAEKRIRRALAEAWDEFKRLAESQPTTPQEAE